MANYQVHGFVYGTLLVAFFFLGVFSDRNALGLNRNEFPVDFVFGTATSAYQVEGAAREAGKGPSNWDVYTHIHPERIVDRSNGDVAADSYHLYQEDVHLIKETGFDAYRFSISWSRLLPTGKPSGGVNKEGIKYYSNLIDDLLSNGIQPYVTIFHFDIPQGLVDEYGGFMSPLIVKDFEAYADLCFREFGDRVKYWITLNEPHTVSYYAYTVGAHAPGRCSGWQNLNCTGGDSATEPYIVTHNQLLAHAATVKLYREVYQATQNGKIGITLSTMWMVPFSDSPDDRDAKQRALDFKFGWFMDPMTTGDYPSSMKTLVKSRLPEFSKPQSEMLKGSYDFLGLNYYTARYVAHVPFDTILRPSYLNDAYVDQLVERDGVPIGPQAEGSPWLYVYPEGFYKILLYVQRKYNNPIIYVTENGFCEKNDPTLRPPQVLNDYNRTSYYYQHLLALRNAFRFGVNVKGYFAWSLLDNFEWSDGYTSRFGIHYVDFETRTRYPKSSAYWFRNFLSNNIEEPKRANV